MSFSCFTLARIGLSIDSARGSAGAAGLAAGLATALAATAGLAATATALTAGLAESILGAAALVCICSFAAFLAAI